MFNKRVGSREPWLAAGVIVLIVSFFVQQSLGQALANGDVSSGDQGGYLRLALKTLSGQGFSNDNYRPLLPLLLQPIAARDWVFFSHAKFFNIALAGLGLLGVFALGRRLFGPVPALLAVLALSLNAQFVEYAGRTEPEALLTGLFFAAWATWALGFTDRRWWWLAGPLAGLAALAKGTGQFFLIGFMLLPLLRQGPGGWRSRWPWLLVGLYLLAASPLLWDRARENGSPFYDFNSAHAMWYDSWDDRYLTPDGEQTTAQTYFATHTPTQVLERVWGGLYGMGEMWRRALALALPASTQWGLALVTGVLACVGVWGLSTETAPPAPARATTRVAPTHRWPVWRDVLWTFGVLFVPTYVFFAWYMPVIASPRFELPLVPIVYLLLAALAWQGLTRLTRWRLETPLALAVACLTLVWLAAGTWITPGQVIASDRARNQTSVAIFEYLTQVERPSGTVILGPNANLATWPFYGLTSFEPIPSTVTTWPAMAAFIDDEGATHVVLNAEMVKRRSALLASFFRVEGDRVTFDALPPGWTLVYAYPTRPCAYCIFRVNFEGSAS